MSAYAELAVTTNFSFLRGASHPDEMVATAAALNLSAIGIADRNSFAGVVRAYDEAHKHDIKLVVGVRLVSVDGFEVLAYPTDRTAYGRLCRLLTAGNLKARKGECHLTFEEILDASDGQMLIALPTWWPAFATNVRLPKPDCGSPSTPSGISSRRRSWRGCSKISRMPSRAALRSPRPAALSFPS
jgi:error-prone DNA polymerase